MTGSTDRNHCTVQSMTANLIKRNTATAPPPLPILKACNHYLVIKMACSQCQPAWCTLHSLYLFVSVLFLSVSQTGHSAVLLREACSCSCCYHPGGHWLLQGGKSEVSWTQGHFKLVKFVKKGLQSVNSCLVQTSMAGRVYNVD